MNHLYLFVSQFAVVFLLGLQSLSVRDSRYAMAAIGSLALGICQVFQWKTMPDASTSEALVWLTAGPIAIVSSMKVHPKLVKYFRR